VRRDLIVGVLLLVLACGAWGQEFSVSYIEGDVQARSGSSWVTLSIGDRISPQTALQLSGGACVEIKWADSKIFLSQKGTYVLRDILTSFQALTSAGVKKAISSTLSILLKGPERNQNDSLGARGANEAKVEDSGWVTSGAQVFLDTGKQYLESGQNKEAIEQFLLALDAATDAESVQVQYYLAYAYSQSGDTRVALKHAASLQPSSSDAWASDFVILKAKLLIDSNAFAQEIAWLTQKEHDLSTDAQRASLYYFLLGVGYRGVGDASNEKANLARVVAISGESDLGKAAALLLQNP